MRLKRTLTTALTFVALFFVSESAASACSCMPPGPPREEAERARAVFAGEVVEVEPAGEVVKKADEKCEQEQGAWQSAMPTHKNVRVRFKVTRVWKNVAASEVVVTTPTNSAACGYAFRKGESYVVYAYGSGELGQLTTGLCSRTRTLSSAEEDLRDLGAGEAPSPSAVASPLSHAADSAKPAAPKPRRLRRVPRRRRT